MQMERKELALTHQTERAVILECRIQSLFTEPKNIVWKRMTATDIEQRFDVARRLYIDVRIFSYTGARESSTIYSFCGFAVSVL